MQNNSIIDTEFDELPPKWSILELSNVATITMGQSPPSSTYNSDGIGLPFLQGKAEFGDIYPNPMKWCTQPQKLAKSGSILISVRAPVGNVNIAKDEYIIGRGLASINGHKILDNRYLFFYLLHSKPILEKKGTGSIFKSINKGVLEQFTIPLPPLQEQCAIAQVLSTVRQAIEATDRVIAAARELKRSMMKYLFTYGPVPISQASQIQLKETEVGEIPETWEIKRAKDVFPRVTDGLHNTPPKLENGIPLVTSKLLRDGKILFEKADYFISPEEHMAANARSGVSDWDIIFSMIGSLVVCQGYKFDMA